MCKYDALLCKGLERPGIWVSVGSWNQSPVDTQRRLHSIPSQIMCLQICVPFS